MKVLWKTSFHLTYAALEKIKMRYSYLKMIENWTEQLGNGEKVGVIFMDHSKAFETINPSLLLPKLKAYGFSNQAKFITNLPS